MLRLLARSLGRGNRHRKKEKGIKTEVPACMSCRLRTPSALSVLGALAIHCERHCIYIYLYIYIYMCVCVCVCVCVCACVCVRARVHASERERERGGDGGRTRGRGELE